MKKKVAILAYYHGPRLGVGVYVDALVSRLERQCPEDFELSLYTNNNTLINSRADFTGIRVVKCCMLSFGSLAAVFWSAIVFPVICFLRRYDVTVILANPIVVMPVRKTISVVQDLNEFEMTSKYGRLRTYYRKRIMLPSALSQSTAIVVISTFVKNQIMRYFPKVPDKKIHVIVDGAEVAAVTEDEVDAVLDEFALQRQRYYLMVGRIDPRGKNLYEGIELYRKLEFIESGHQLVLAGGINKFSRTKAEEFLNWIDRQDDLRGKVTYLGFLGEHHLACLYRSAQAAVFFSRYEGFGLPMIEAFKAGCPVIYNSRCQVLKDHAEGVAFEIDEADSVEDIRSKLADLYDDARRPGLAREMATVAEKYNWDNCAGQFWRLIRAIA